MRRFYSQRRISKITAILLSGLIAFSSGVTLRHAWPAWGAWAADTLRGLVGDQAVADLETFVFQQADVLHQALQKLSPASITSPASLPSQIQDAYGRIIADQAYFYPDPQRSYAQVVVAAFNLNLVRLHFVPGLEDVPPGADETDSLTTLSPVGILPEADWQSGALVAIFNGGFKPRHGNFGISVNGLSVIPMRAELGTLGIYANGQVRIGAWGTEMTLTPDLVAARQNGLLIIQQGKVNPRLVLDDVREWGYIVKNTTPTWRSGVGVNADGDTLYYAAGPSLTLPALAEALRAAGAAQAIQLDVNQAWVYYGAVQKIDSRPQLIPAFDRMPVPNDLTQQPSARDFFYVMAEPD